MIRKRWIVVGSLVLLVVAAGLVAVRPFNINTFFDKAFLQFLINDPELLTRTGAMPKWVPAWYADDLTEVSPQALKRSAQIGRNTLQTLESYDRDKLSDEDRLSYDIFHWFLSNGLAGEPFMYHSYAMTHLNGPHIEIPAFMARVHPMDNEEDARAYLARLTQIPDKFLGLIDLMEVAVDSGIIPPSFMIESMIGQCDTLASKKATEHPLYISFYQRLQTIPSIDTSQQAQLLALARLSVEEDVKPGYARLSSYLRQLLTRSVSIAGVWQMPDGEAFYRYELKRHCTVNIDPDSLFKVGQAELKRQHIALKDAAKAAGINPQLSVTEMFDQLAQTDSLIDDEGFTQARSIMAEAVAKLPEYLGVINLPDLAFESVAQHREATAPVALYNAAEPKTGLNAVLMLNLKGRNRTVGRSYRAAIFHEAVPGHHLQKSMQRNMDQAPMFRTHIPFTAYTEGWGMYAERLADEMGLYHSATQRMGMIRADMIRTGRLLADIGMHHKRWLQDQTVDFLMAEIGLTRDDAIREANRSMAWPGHGCAYKVGEMHIHKLRADLEAKLGEAFDLKKFHMAVLDGGAMPLEVLTAKVTREMMQKPSGPPPPQALKK